MPNASYIRFRNTLADLRDCAEHIHDQLIAGAVVSEHSARIELVTLCAEILEACGVSINPTDIQIIEHEPEARLRLIVNADRPLRLKGERDA
jgi:hypothetical protein